MIITVAAGVVVYGYTIGWLSSAEQNIRAPGSGQLQVDSAVADQSLGVVQVYVRNIGGEALTLDKIYFDGSAVTMSRAVMYVLRPNEGEAAQVFAKAPASGKLIPVGTVSNGVQKFELQVDGKAIDLSSNGVRSIVASYNGGKTTPVNPRMAALSESNLLWFQADSKPGKYTFRFMGMNKETFEAEINWK
jgi:hypothetical protein